MIGILSQIQVRCSSQLFFDDQSLLQKLKTTGQKFVLDLQEVTFAYVHLEGFIDDWEPMVVLDILPSTVTMSYNA